MTTEQIYSVVNEVNKEAFGSNALAVVDTSSLISLGNTVLSSSSNTEAFLNTLAQRIGRTIMRYRKYRNKLGNMVLNDFEYGAILQKIKVMMPEAEEDEMYDLVDGSSIDHYKVSKPKVEQKLFVTRTPYQYHITIQRETLKEAFTGENEMGSFISTVFGEVRNAIELGLENLSRVTLATAIAEVAGSTREYKLVTMYNNDFQPSTPLTAATAINNEEFMRYAVGVMNTVLDGLSDMSDLYNDGTMETFTPVEDLRVKVISKFQRKLETVVEYGAFHDKFTSLDSNYDKINFWQSKQSGSEFSVNIKRPSDGEATAVNNVVAIMHDRDAMGVYKYEEEVATTPINAAGLYYNQYWHEKQLRFIDLSENIVIFSLN